MKMYVWSIRPKWLAVAHANSVTEARELLLSADNIGESGDGSCSVRDAARKHVNEMQPSCWVGPNAEFALTDSSELMEQEEYSRILFSLGVELATALKALIPEGWGDDTMGHMRGIKLARIALQHADGKLGHWSPTKTGAATPKPLDAATLERCREVALGEKFFGEDHEDYNRACDDIAEAIKELKGKE